MDIIKYITKMTDDFSEKWALGPQSESIRSILEFMAIGLITDVFV